MKRKQKKQFSVPMTVSLRGFALVEAYDANEASILADEGKFELHPGAEMFDWETTGEPEAKE